MGFLSRMIAKTVGEVIRTQAPKLLDQKLPPIIEHLAVEKFAIEPNAQLTEAGFGWALAVSLRKHWPDVPREQAASVAMGICRRSVRHEGLFLDACRRCRSRSPICR